jgi:glycine/serine hydroxymethyltransferase
MRNAVKTLQKSTIQGFDGIRIGEVDALITVGIHKNEFSQLGRVFDESVKVVTALMAVTRVKLSRRFV